MPLGYRRIVQGEEIDAGGRRWRVEIGHGHAPEQATLWGVGHDLVLAGDQVLPGITPNLGVYATEPDADPVGDWLASSARLVGLAEPRHLALPGHRRPFLGLPARLAEFAAHGEAASPGCATSSPRRGGRPTASGCSSAGASAPRVRPRARRGGRPPQPPPPRRRGDRRHGADGAWLWQRRDLGPDSAAASG